MRIARQFFLLRRAHGRVFLSREGRHVSEHRFAERYSSLNTTPDGPLILAWLVQDLYVGNISVFSAHGTVKITPGYSGLFAGVVCE